MNTTMTLEDELVAVQLHYNEAARKAAGGDERAAQSLGTLRSKIEDVKNRIRDQNAIEEARAKGEQDADERERRGRRRRAVQEVERLIGKSLTVAAEMDVVVGKLGALWREYHQIVADVKDHIQIATERGSAEALMDIDGMPVADQIKRRLMATGVLPHQNMPRDFMTTPVRGMADHVARKLRRLTPSQEKFK